MSRSSWRLATVLCFAAVPTDTWSQASASFNTGRIFVGGGVGVGFGDVTYVNVSPFVGYRVDERLSVGAGLIYRHRNDERFGRDISTNDYGANLFARYTVVGPFFVQSEVETLSYEYVRADLSTNRTNATSFFGGGGVSQPISRNASVYVAALYNFSHGSQSPSTYSSPWVIRFGIGMGF